MGIGDDIANAAKDAVGKAKESIGGLIGNDDLADQGRIDQATAAADRLKDDAEDAAKHAVQDVKDAAADVKDAAQKAVNDAKDALS